jgi:hypothetical protein
MDTPNDSADCIHKLKSTTQLRKNTQGLMLYLEGFDKLQSRTQTKKAKRAVQQYVELVEQGIDCNDLLPVYEIFDSVQKHFLTETTVHSATKPAQTAETIHLQKQDAQSTVQCSICRYG